jgi:hypothetical protein
MNLRAFIKEVLEEKLSKEIICYHRSNSFEHMMDGDFSIEKSSDTALFGPAIYFAQSPNISSQLGKYICKFAIKLDAPVLDMNSAITASEANQLLAKFNDMFGLNIFYDYSDMGDLVQYGEFFEYINDEFNWEHNKHYTKFIHSLGYKSFIYYGNYHTDFLDFKGDYGLCYGIYNPSSIRFIDGPF